MKTFQYSWHILAFVICSLLWTNISVEAQQKIYNIGTQDLPAAQSDENQTAQSTELQDLARKYIEQQNLAFMENKGQIRDTEGNPRPDLHYLMLGGDVRLYFSTNSVSYVFTRVTKVPVEAKKEQEHFLGRRLKESATESRVSTYRMDMQLLGSNPNPSIRSEQPLPGFEHFYTTTDKAGVTYVKSYRKLVYEEIYPHIDLVFYVVDGSSLKYDFVVRPGGNVADIRLVYQGSDRIDLTPTGAVKILNSFGMLSEDAPFTYQETPNRQIVASESKTSPRFETAGAKLPVSSRFVVQANQITFDVGEYDRSKTLVIDPNIEWSTYLGEPRVSMLFPATTMQWMLWSMVIWI